ncbi:MAG: hypothetical protein ACRD0C_00210 [Acidimicrobiia bacterium]
MPETPSKIGSPEQMRQAVADYVTAVHRAYLAATAGLAPELVAALPLPAAGEFSVLAVGAGNLHLIATAQAPAPAQGRVVEMDGAVGPLRWRLRFYDPVVVPALASVGGAAVGPDAGDEVRRVLGVDVWLYHLVASPGAGLSPHNAAHAGAALAQGHVRDVVAAGGEER